MTRVLGIAGLLLAQVCNADEFPVPCSFFTWEPEPDYVYESHCAVRDGDSFRLAPDYKSLLKYDSSGLASLVIDAKWYYVNADGRMQNVLTHDNGPDEFHDGLVRTLVAGKIAYLDSTFREIIPPKYDWGFPFENGMALVCTGCRIAGPDSDGHRAVVGGLWGCIDPNGTVLTPVTHSDDDKPPCDF